MNNNRINSISPELEEIILEEKLRGTSDIEIGRKYGVNFKTIEKIITKAHGINISKIPKEKRIKNLEPKNFQEEKTTVWSFKSRGSWATHSGEYRGNWSPYIPRNIILKYSKPGEIVLDYFCGAGTTAVESKLLGRKCIAIDINDKAIELAKKNLDFDIDSQQLLLFNNDNNISTIYEPELIIGDARDLSFIENDSIDLICAHPPYANIIHYTNSKDGDLSFLDVDEFLNEMFVVAKESFRVLKPGRKCAILIGDTRVKKHIVPLGFKLIDVFLKAGFLLKELVIKRQHNCKTTGFWYENSIKYNFLLLAHEYLPIFEKPSIDNYHTLKEDLFGYTTYSFVNEEIKFGSKLDILETTTVWIFPKFDFEKLLVQNIVNRYSNKKDYSIITLYPENYNEKNDLKKKPKKGVELLFIKSPVMQINSYIDVDNYINKVEELVKHELTNIKTGGFLVIHTQDVRINGYIEPMAKRIIEKVVHKNLWLKEIVIVTMENETIKNDLNTDELKIMHSYLIVFDKL